MPRKMIGTSPEVLQKRAAEIDRILTRIFGRQEASGSENPIDTLIETILSQNTTDLNSHKAFDALKKRYPRWESLLSEKPSTVAAIIRGGGLAMIKAGRIIDALKFIEKERGKLDLDFLREMTPRDAEKWLAQMKGVGPKTRGIVLLFSLRMPAFPVDTHIHRVTKRIGLIGPQVSREDAQEVLAGLVPESEYYNFHINLIFHGRTVCPARNPKCPICRVSHLCSYYYTVFLARS
jgi:endonuclease-3